MIGEKFRFFTVLERAGINKHRQTLWRCRCVCGAIRDVVQGNLRSGGSGSCGCMRAVRHGHTRGRMQTATYMAYRDAIARCYNKNTRNYPNYGGRGINVCKRWRDGFENFLADMGE